MLPVSAFAAEAADVVDNDTPGGDEPKCWLQQYQKYILTQIAACGPIMTAAALGIASYRMIIWANGESNRLVFGNRVCLGDKMPCITLGGRTVSCGDWNGQNLGGSYVQSGEENDPVIISDLDKIMIEEQIKAVRAGYDMDIIPSNLVIYGDEAKNL